MNFTGASAYTSLSGVKKEMQWALPLQISAAVVGLILWLGSQFMA
jgi:acetyl-CoA decarbonylase/synthase complex subunit gamma